MPNFPRAQSRGQITTQRPSVEASSDTNTQMIEQVGKIGQQIQEATVKWSNAVDTMQKTKSQVNFKSGMLDLEARAAADPDYNNSDQYFKEIAKLKSESLKGFSSKAAEAEMALNLGLESQVSKIKIDNIYKKKMMDVYASDIEGLIETEIQNPSPGSLGLINAKLDEGVSSLLISKEAATKARIKANKDLGANRINNDLYQADTVEKARAIKESIRNGDYELGGVDIDPKTKSTMIRSAEVKERQIMANNNAQTRIVREERTHDLIQKANNHVLEATELEEAFNNGEISNSTFNSLNGYQNGIVGPSADTDKVAYQELIQALLTDNVSPEKSRNMILDANTEGKISRDDAKKIYNMHFGSANNPSVAEALGGEQTQQDFASIKANFDAEQEALKDKKGFLKTAYNMAKSFFGTNKDENITEAIQNVYKEVLDNNGESKDIPIAMEKQLSKANLKKHPEWAKIPEKGANGVDRFGNKVTVYPDGRVVRS